MPVKEVYAIRINKNDDEAIKKYLEQFPSSKQNKALKSLLKYGIEKLQEDYAKDQAITRLQETILQIQEEQKEKLEEIKKLISNMQAGKMPMNNETTYEEETPFDMDKAKKTMEQALSMFLK